MKPSDFFSALLTFFNDFVGVAAPGFIFIVALTATNNQAAQGYQFVTAGFQEGLWLLGIVFSYASGHVLLALHLAAVQLLQKIGILDKDKPVSSAGLALDKIVRKKLKSQDAKKIDIQISDLRSLAMSMTTEAAELGRRFMFISLFCNGAATSLLAVALLSFLPEATNDGNFWPIRLTLVLTAALLYWRGAQFERRAWYVPFPIALSAALFEEKSEGTEST